MGTSLVTARPTTSLRPSWRSIDCSPEVLVSLNTGPKLIARFGERERPQHRLSLGFSLREFVCGIGIGDDAGAGLHADAILEHERRADRNRRIETRRTPPDVSDCAGVRSPALGLQLIDDFHRAYFGRAANGPRGEAGAEDVERIIPGTQSPADFADEMLHVRVALDLERLRDADRAVTRHPAHIIAAEVHEHAVLSQLLRVAAQRRGQRLVLGGPGTARARTRDRPHGHFVTLDTHQHFGLAAAASRVVA